MRYLGTPLALIALIAVGCGDNLPTESDPNKNVGEQEILFNKRIAGDTVDVMAVKPDGSGLRTVLRSALVVGVRGGRMLWGHFDGDSVFISALDGSGRQVVPGVNGWPVLSPNGSAVAWTMRGSNNRSLAVLQLPSATPRLLADSLDYETIPAWSPDGRQLAFYRNDEALCIVDVQNGALRVLDTAGYGYGDNQARISWSRDGRYLAYIGRHYPEGTDVYVINSDGTGRVRITDDADEELSPLLTPDGASVIFQDFSGDELHLSRANRVGGVVTDLTSRFANSKADIQPQITADGRQLLYSAFNGDWDHDPAGTLYVMDLVTGNAVRAADSAWFGYWSGGMGF